MHCFVSTIAYPQRWDPDGIKHAVGHIERLAEGLAADPSGDAYRFALNQVICQVFPDGEGLTVQQAGDRLAWLLYGAAAFGHRALAVGEELTGRSRADLLALLYASFETARDPLTNRE